MQFKLQGEVFCIALFTIHFSLFTFFLHLEKRVAIAAA